MYRARPAFIPLRVSLPHPVTGRRHPAAPTFFTSAIQTVILPSARRRRILPGGAPRWLWNGGWQVGTGVQGFPKQPGLRKFGCAGGIVAGLLIFLTMGLACCYAIVDVEIKLHHA